MSILDLTLLVLLVWALVDGLWRGLVSQLIDLAAFVLALAAAASVGPTVGRSVDQWIALPDQYQTAIGAIAVVAVVTGVLRSGFRLMGRMIPAPIVALPLNRILGVVPSLAKLFLLVTVTLTVVNAVPGLAEAHRAIQESRVAPTIVKLGQSMTSLTERMLGPLTERLEVQDE